MQTNFTLYTKENCPVCDDIKSKFKEHNIQYVEFVIGKDITREEVLRRFPDVKLAPLIVEDGIIISIRAIEALIDLKLIGDKND